MMKSALAFALGMMCLLGTAIAAHVAPAAQVSGDEGKQLYLENCAGCHKWDGHGGGGYGGAALSLRKTGLDRAQIIMTVSCGRPATGMPYHLRDAYTKAHPCYGSTSLAPLGKFAPLEANNFLRPAEINAVVDYVLHNIKGRGETTFGECQAFWGTTSRVCDDYRKAPAQAGEKNKP